MAYVHSLCTWPMYTAYVHGLCTQLMYPVSVSYLMQPSASPRPSAYHFRFPAANSANARSSRFPTSRDQLISPFRRPSVIPAAPAMLAVPARPFLAYCAGMSNRRRLNQSESRSTSGVLRLPPFLSSG